MASSLDRFRVQRGGGKNPRTPALSSKPSADQDEIRASLWATLVRPLRLCPRSSLDALADKTRWAEGRRFLLAPPEMFAATRSRAHLRLKGEDRQLIKDA